MDSRIEKRLNEHVLQAHQHWCQSVTGGTFERSRDWARGYTGSTVSTFNLLLLLNERALSDDLLSDAAAYFDERRVPHVVAYDDHWLSGGSNFLHARSYQPLPPLPGMVLLGEARRLPCHSEVSIQRVESDAAIGGFCDLVSELFGLPLIETAQLFSTSQLNDDAIRHYLGYLDGEPVVAGSTILAEGIVSVWNVATQDEFRRQGVATAFMQCLLAESWEDGCDASLLYSTPMAYSMYQKLGYTLYTQRRSFLPPEW